MNDGHKSVSNKVQGKLGRGNVLSTFKSKNELSKQNLQDLIPGIDLKQSNENTMSRDLAISNKLVINNKSSARNPLKA